MLAPEYSGSAFEAEICTDGSWRRNSKLAVVSRRLAVLGTTMTEKESLCFESTVLYVATWFHCFCCFCCFRLEPSMGNIRFLAG